ncbi:hypothetical protein TI04_06930 [Achromatium sp. WMS2]|nr:hypothetical protein TI04_06930 [Achromatium sp. WMS2]
MNNIELLEISGIYATIGGVITGVISLSLCRITCYFNTTSGFKQTVTSSLTFVSILASVMAFLGVCAWILSTSA